MIKGIIFDLDGTLLNSLEDLQIATNYVLVNNGCKTISLEQTKAFVGNGNAKLLARAFSCFNKPYQDSYLDMFKDYYNKHLTDNTIPYDGIMELVKSLKNNNIKMAICSNKYQQAVNIVCKPFFENIIDYFIGASDKIRTKPDLDMINLALESMNIKANECLYVGDSDVDFITAKKANIKFVFVSWGFKKIDDDTIDYRIDKPNQLLDIIKENEDD